MNGNLAYLQLDFTVESQANLAPDCMVMQEKSKSFRGPRWPPTPRPTLLLGLRPSAHGRPSNIFRYLPPPYNFKNWKTLIHILFHKGNNAY